MTFDILIKDGTIIDGTGRPRFRGDVGISGERIKDIGQPSLAGAKAAKTVAAAGKFIAPGFIDITNHGDKSWAIFQNPQQDYLLTQGITTTLGGNCGTSLAPLPAPEAAAALQKWSLASEANINWTTVAEFLDELAKHPIGVNFGTLVGHGTIRRGILRGESRALTGEELEQFQMLLKQSLAEGAFGLSAGLGYSHEAAATTEELAALARVLAETESIYKPHLRHEGFNLAPAVNETMEIIRQSKAPVVISHFKAIGRQAWPFFAKALAIVERAAEDGLTLFFDITPYQRTGSFLYLLLPVWAREGGFEAVCDRMQIPETRAQMIEELERQTLHYDQYLVATSSTPSTNGYTIREIAERTGQTPEDAILELILANRGRVSIFGKALSFRNLETGLAHPRSIIATNGSGVSAELRKTEKLVHPRSTGAMPHFLHRFVREKGLLSWEEGIRKMTALPAEIVGFKGRGRIEKQYYADIVVFDPETIRDRSTYQNPYVHSAGIEAVTVNGKLAIESGQLTGVTAGQVLKKS